MSDEALRMPAEIVDKFTNPLRRLRDGLRSVRTPPEMLKLKSDFGALDWAAGKAADGIKGGLNAALIGVGIGSLGASAAVTALIASLKGFAFGTSELRAFGKETGLSVQRLKELQALGERFHINPDATIGGLQRFSENLSDVKRRFGSTYGELLAIAPEFTEQLFNSKNVEEAVGRALTMLGRQTNATNRKRIAELLFGSPDFGRFGSEGVEVLKKRLGEVRESLGKLPEGAIESAEQFNQAFQKFQESLTRVRDEIGAKALPELTKQLDDLQTSMKGFDFSQIGAGIKAFLADIRKGVEDVRSLAGDLNKLAHGDFTPLKEAFELKKGDSAMPFGIKPATPNSGTLTDTQRDVKRLSEELRKNSDELEKNRREMIEKQSFNGLPDTPNLGGLLHKASFSPSGLAPTDYGSSISRGLGRGRSVEPMETPSGTPDGPIAPFKGNRTFTSKAPEVMARLMKDFGFTRDQAAGIVGNLGHESAGFRAFQEGRPRGGRGGWGWAQWTGPRRRAFERWVAEKGLDPKSDEANYGFLKYELEHTARGRRAVAELRQQKTASQSMLNFEHTFEGAGVKAYGSRMRYTNQALSAFDKSIDSRTRVGDDLMRRSRDRQTVEGNASVRIDLNGFPKGTKVTPKADGMFKEIDLNRGVPMATGTDV